MKHLKKFNENIEIDWSKSEKEIGKLVLNEINRIFKKTLSGTSRSGFFGKDLEWSDTPKEEFEYQDDKLVKVGERKVFLKLKQSVKEELEELLYVEEVYDRLLERFTDVVDEYSQDVNLFLRWVYNPDFKNKKELRFIIAFEFFNLNLLSLSESIQLIVKIIGSRNIEEWSISDDPYEYRTQDINSKSLIVDFKFEK